MRAILKLVIFFLTTLALDAKVQVEVDFGERGNAQKITEKSIKDQFNAGLKDFNASEKYSEFKNSIPKIAMASTNIQQCESNTTRIFEPGMTLSKDYFTPDGRIVGKTGEKINPLKNLLNAGFLSKIVIFDGTDSEQISYVKTLCSFGEKCSLFISNGNAMEIEKELNITTSPIPKLLAESLDVRCSLSVYEVQNTHFLIKQLSVRSKKK